MKSVYLSTNFVKGLRFIYLYIICLCAIAGNSFAQDSNYVSNKIEQMKSVYKDYRTSLTQIPGVDSADISLLSDAAKKNQFDSSSNFNQQITQARIDLLKKEIGLTGSLGYLENLTPNVGEPEENVIYNRRIQLGVEWDFLKSGFTQNQYLKKSLENQLYYDKYLDEANSLDRKGFIQQMNYVITHFNERKKIILNQREYHLNRQDSIANALFLLKQIKNEDYIDIKTRRAETQGMMAIYKSYNQYSDVVLNHEKNRAYPLVDLNYSYIISLLDESDTVLLNQFDWEKIADLKNKWWNEISGKVYARYNFYDLAQTNPDTRSFFSLGLNLRVPLIFNHKRKKQIDLLKFEKQHESVQALKNHEKEEILNLVYEYRYKLKQYISSYQKRLYFSELLRKEEVKLEFNDADFNPIKAINLIDDIHRVDIELNDLLQNLYIKALRINFKIHDSQIENLVYPFELPQIDIEENKIEKGVFVWTKTVDSLDNGFLKQYLRYNQFNHMFIAANLEGKEEPLKKQLIESFNGSVYLMIGNNDFINTPDQSDKIKGMLSGYSSNIKGVHLDVEPHTFDDWKTNKTEYYMKYVSMVKQVRQTCDEKGLQLNISIPLYYDTVVVKELLTLVDHIDFMCYENIKQSYILKKIAPYMGSYKEKIGISLRTEDFEQKIAMFAYGIELSKLTGIKRINYHSLRRLINMDEKYLNLD